MDKSAYVYVTYIEASAERVWQALTDGEITRQYWAGQQNVSEADWAVGSEWRHVVADDPSAVYGVGTVVESDRPRRLVVTWGAPDAQEEAAFDRVTYDIAEDQGVTRLTVTNTNVEPDSGTASTWPMILAGLKTLLETGEPLPSFWAREDGSWRMVRFG